MSLPVRLVWMIVLLTGLAPTGPHAGRAQTQGATERPFEVVARRYTFLPARIEVRQGDLVRIQLSTEDIAHSLTIDDYRIAKRVSPGQTVTFEFRAERAGTFPFYCDLKAEEGCRKMRGELVVRPRN
jgi:heme/copper-type cytochrome/quinol oxidase subunit 2